MVRQKLNNLCAITPVVLSLLAGLWVLANVFGGARAGGDEGLGFYVFWLLVLAQGPFVVAYLITADWRRIKVVAAQMVLQVAALVLAFLPVAYFRL